MSGERALQDAHLVAHVKHFAFWKLDQAVALARPDLSDDGVRHARRYTLVEHDANHDRPPASGVPLLRP
jgi:hypothetical protein